MASAKRGLKVPQLMSCTSEAISSRLLPVTACGEHSTNEGARICSVVTLSQPGPAVTRRTRKSWVAALTPHSRALLGSHHGMSTMARAPWREHHGMSERQSCSVRAPKHSRHNP